MALFRCSVAGVAGFVVQWVLSDALAFLSSGPSPAQGVLAAANGDAGRTLGARTPRASAQAPPVKVSAMGDTRADSAAAVAVLSMLLMARAAERRGRKALPCAHGAAVIPGSSTQPQAPSKAMNAVGPPTAGVVAVTTAAFTIAAATMDAASAAEALAGVADAATGIADAATGVADVSMGVVEAAADVAEATQPPAPTDDAGFFEPLVQANAGIIAGIDDVAEEVLHLPNSFGWAIIGYTIFIKAITFPLNQSALRTNAMMQILGPKVKQIQTKYKNDQETQNRMMLRLYDDAGVNPLGGCLPSLLQLPIFIALYRAINSLAQKNVHFKEPFLWIPSLSGPVDAGQPSLDWLTKSQFPDHFEPLIGWEQAGRYLILPAMLVVSQFFTQQQASPNQAQQQGPLQYVTNVFPFIIGYTTLVSPAGLGIYWFMNNLLTQAQTTYIKNSLSEEFPQYKKIIDGTASTPESVQKEVEADEVETLPRGFGSIAPPAATKAAATSGEEGGEEEAVVAKSTQASSSAGYSGRPMDKKERQQRKAKRLARRRRR